MTRTDDKIGNLVDNLISYISDPQSDSLVKPQGLRGLRFLQAGGVLLGQRFDMS